MRASAGEEDADGFRTAGSRKSRRRNRLKQQQQRQRVLPGAASGVEGVSFDEDGTGTANASKGYGSQVMSTRRRGSHGKLTRQQRRSVGVGVDDVCRACVSSVMLTSRAL